MSLRTSLRAAPPLVRAPPSRPSTPRRRTRTQPHPTRFVSEHLSFLFRPQGVCRSKAELHGNPDSTAVGRRMAAGCRHSLPRALLCCRRPFLSGSPRAITRRASVIASGFFGGWRREEQGAFRPLPATAPTRARRHPAAARGEHFHHVTFTIYSNIHTASGKPTRHTRSTRHCPRDSRVRRHPSRGKRDL